MSLFPQEPIDFDLPDARVILYEHAFAKAHAEQFYNTLLEEIDWQQDDIKVFGKVYAQPRLTALYSTNDKPYSYSNITMQPQVFDNTLAQIKQEVERITGHTFTTCLCNLYRDGQDSNGWHADDEKELGQNPVIASVSFGATRRFKMRHKKDTSLKQDIELTSGSLLLMKGTTQHFWQHQIPKTKRAVPPRINLTFRVIK